MTSQQNCENVVKSSTETFNTGLRSGADCRQFVARKQVERTTAAHIACEMAARHSVAGFARAGLVKSEGNSAHVVPSLQPKSFVRLPPNTGLHQNYKCRSYVQYFVHKVKQVMLELWSADWWHFQHHCVGLRKLLERCLHIGHTVMQEIRS